MALGNAGQQAICCERKKSTQFTLSVQARALAVIVSSTGGFPRCTLLEPSYTCLPPLQHLLFPLFSSSSLPPQLQHSRTDGRDDDINADEPKHRKESCRRRRRSFLCCCHYRLNGHLTFPLLHGPPPSMHVLRRRSNVIHTKFQNEFADVCMYNRM